MGMDRELTIFDANHGVVHILHTPYQHVRPLLMSMVTQVRAKIAAAARSDLIKLHSFDSEVYHKAMKAVPADKINRLRLLHAMGGSVLPSWHAVLILLMGAVICGGAK